MRTCDENEISIAYRHSCTAGIGVSANAEGVLDHLPASELQPDCGVGADIGVRGVGMECGIRQQ